jgi:hypothetical protein
MEKGYKSITGLVDIPASTDAPISSAGNADNTGTQVCGICGSLIVGNRYFVGSKFACSKCAGGTGEAQTVDESAGFARGILFGIAAAIVGLAFYATFTIVTHFYIGYVALAVGWMVGKAIMTGSNGVGGPRYQIAAVLLTYAAISLAEIPILIARAIEHGASDIDWGTMAGKLVLWGIASPFLELQDGPFAFIGLVILFVGLRIAYRMTKAKRRVVRSSSVIG